LNATITRLKQSIALTVTIAVDVRASQARHFVERGLSKRSGR
jgi:hypothetical protein